MSYAIFKQNGIEKLSQINHQELLKLKGSYNITKALIFSKKSWYAFTSQKNAQEFIDEIWVSITDSTLSAMSKEKAKTEIQSFRIIKI